MSVSLWASWVPTRDCFRDSVLTYGLIATLLAICGLDPAFAQKVPREQAVIGSTVTVAPNPRYESNGLGTMLFGTDYRSVWATPVAIPVLDIGSYAGGLTPLKRGGFGQTTSLHMRGSDGVRYVFRSLDKSPDRALSEDLKNTFVADVMRDQISSQHPYASLVVPDLLQATGVLHVTPTLYIMPDDARLGEFQDDYAGLVGAIEERPDEAPDGGPGFAGAAKVKSSSSMYEDLEKRGHERVNEIAFLQARLMDIYLGDRDRHFDQWRWARMDNPDGSRSWFPVPKDRDQAFKVNDGLMMTALRIYQPQFTSFGKDYDRIDGAAFNGRELDRRLLVGLEDWEWDSVAVDMQRRLSDEVIEKAVGRLPSEVFAESGQRMLDELKSRRDLLPEMASDYYRLLADVVDLHSSDDPDVVSINRQADGRIHVEIRTQSGFPYFERMFDPDETSEIRVLTHGGDDSLTVSGTGIGGITLRVLPGGGSDVMIDTSIRDSGSKTRWYDHRGKNVVTLGPNARLDDGKPYQKHPDELFLPPHPEDTDARKQQTYGQYWYPVGSISYAPDFGAVIHGGVYQIKHGFRRQPFQYKWSIEGTVTTSSRSKLMTRLDVPDFGPGWESHLYAHWSRIEVIRFNGFGNTSALEQDGGSSFYKTESTQVTGSLFFTKHITGTSQFDFGPIVTYSNDESGEDGEDRFVTENADSLFGILDNLVLVGAGLSFTLDSRDNEGAAQRGFFLNLQGRGVPQVFGADSVGGYGRIFGAAATYLTLAEAPLSPTFAIRIGGAAVDGDYPYYRASFLGGIHTIRGYRKNRYAGDAMAFGNAELRLKGLSFPLIFPWDVGIYGFFDGGRVWYSGDPTNESTIHTAYGGGLWFSVLSRTQTFRISYAVGEEENLIYFGAGFHF